MKVFACILALVDARPFLRHGPHVKKELRDTNLTEAPLLADVPKFIISLSRKDSRFPLVAKRLKHFGPAFQNSCRVQAVDGNAMGSHVYRGSLRPGQAGCSLSHMKVWHHIVEQEIPVSLVIEDDGLSGMESPHFVEYVQNAVADYKDYDVFRLYRSTWRDKPSLDNVMAQKHNMLAGSSDCRRQVSTAIYIMTYHGAKVALAKYKYGQLPLDNYKEGYPTGNSFRVSCYEPNIIAHPTLSSELNNPANVHHVNVTSEWDQVLPDCQSQGLLMKGKVTHADLHRSDLL